MVSDIFINIFATAAVTFGLDAATLTYIFAVGLAVGAAAIFALGLKNKDIGLPIFLLMMFLMTMIGAFEWLYLILIFILVGFFYYQGHKQGGIAS